MTSPDEGPEWANEAHLDEVFSTWVPGPPDSASAAEKEMAGENPRLELPAEDEISDEDMEAALAAALAEAERSGDTAPDGIDAEPVVAPAPSSGRAVPSEPASPSWLTVPEPAAPPAPLDPITMAPGPVFEPEPETKPEAEAEAEPIFEPELEPVFQADLEPDSLFEPEPEPFSKAEPEPEPPAVFEPEAPVPFEPEAPVPFEPEPAAFEPGPPPPEPTRVARPWSRSDDDILPERKGKGRRR